MILAEYGIANKVSQMTMTALQEWWSDPLLRQLSLLLSGFLLIGVLVRVLRQYLVQRIHDGDRRYQVRKFITFSGYIVALVFVLAIFSHQLSTLTVAFGVAGAGIAFALQEVIASVAGFVAVSFGGFYKIGDRVQLGGIKGDVIDIGILRTTLMEIGEWVKSDAYNGRVVRVANSFVFKEPVFNYSGDFPFLWDELTLPVKYGSDYPEARRLLLDAAQAVIGYSIPEAQKAWRGMLNKYRIEDASVEPMVTVTANDNWVEFTLRYVTDYKRRRLIRDALFSRILEAVEQPGSRVTIASGTLQIISSTGSSGTGRP
jgi:small-conductance mechanosensitive channel